MADDQNPWSLEGWSMTAQMAYVSRNGMARAQARARDAGTTVGGRPPAPKVAPRRADDPSNPWSAAGWSRTAQAQYLAAHGLARAEARARDAGSSLLGQPAPHAGTMAPAALVRPGSGAIYRVPPDGSAFIPQRRRPTTSPGTLPRVTMAIGLAEAAALYREMDIAASMAIGLAAAAVVQAISGGGEVDVPISIDGLGITAAAALYTEADLAVSAALGITAAAALYIEADLAASAALGLAMSSTLRTEADLAASLALGIAMAASTIYTEADLAASVALGVTMAAPLQAEVDLLIDVRSTEDGDIRITQAGDTRVTETVAEGLGVSMAVATLTLV